MKTITRIQQFVDSTAASFLLPADIIPYIFEGLILGAIILIALTACTLGTRFFLFLKLPERILITWSLLRYPSFLFFLSWSCVHFLRDAAAPYLVMSTASVIFTLWLAVRVTDILPIKEEQRRIAVFIFSGLALLSVSNWLRPFVNMLERASFPVGDGEFSLLGVFQAIIIFTLITWVSFASATWLEARMEKRRLTAAARTLFLKIYKTVAIVLAGLITLNMVGLNLSSLTIFGGALGIGIGFGLKTVTSNFISGILLLMDKSIKPGDVISVDDTTFGQVKAMNSRYIVLKRRDGMEVLIPNEQLMIEQVINWSFSSKTVRQDVTIGVSYDSDMEHVAEVLLEAVKEVPRVVEVPSPIVFILDFADSSVVFNVRYWQNDPENGVGNLKGAVRMAMWKALKKNKVEIPFPQLVLHEGDKRLPPKPTKTVRKRSTSSKK